MKTLNSFLVLVFMVVMTIQTYAQEMGVPVAPKPGVAKPVSTAINETAKVDPSGVGPFMVHTELSGIENQIYIGAHWPVGRILLRDGSKIDDYNLRYNLLADQMQFIAGKDTLAFASPLELNTVTFDDHTFVYETYQCENFVRQGYFELLEPGKNKLLLKRFVSFQVHDKNVVAPGTESYIVDQCYFISRPGKPAFKIMCNKKSVLTNFPEHKAELEAYIKATGNKVRTTDDLRKVVSYYNSLEGK
jgi:hypothetical protein